MTVVQSVHSSTWSADRMNRRSLALGSLAAVVSTTVSPMGPGAGALKSLRPPASWAPASRWFLSV